MAKRNIWRIGCGLIIVLLFGMALAAAAFVAYRQHDSAERLDDSLNGEAPIQPTWARLERPCQPASARQRAQDQAAMDLALAFAGNDRTTGLNYAFKYFGWHWRIDGHLGRCPPDARHYALLAPLADRAGWPTLRPDTMFDLDLADHLPPGPGLAARLARLAFNPYPIQLEPLNRDARPRARTLLAAQGPYARPWSARAIAGIAPATRLGTSAAYLAVATAPAKALPKVETAMRDMTSLALSRQVRNSNGAGIAIRDGYRLYELAYAISMAGPAARPYAGPLIALLDRKFATGSHFGLLLLDPVALCDVSAYIGGEVLAAAKRKPYCVERFTEKKTSTNS